MKVYIDWVERSVIVNGGHRFVGYTGNCRPKRRGAIGPFKVPCREALGLTGF